MLTHRYDITLGCLLPGILIEENKKGELGIVVGNSFVRFAEGFNPELDDDGLLLECGIFKPQKGRNENEYFLTEVSAGNLCGELKCALIYLNTFTTHESNDNGSISGQSDAPRPRVIASGHPSTKNYSVASLIVLPNNSSLEFCIQLENVVQRIYNDNGIIILS